MIVYCRCKKNFQKRISQQGIVEEDILWSSGKLEPQFVSQQKAADYMKMLNDLSLAQERRCQCGEKWIFQQDKAAIHNSSITKKNLLEQKKKTARLSNVLSIPQSYRKFVGIDCCKSLWKRSTVFNNFWTQKRNLRRMGKNAFGSTSQTSLSYAKPNFLGYKS